MTSISLEQDTEKPSLAVNVVTTMNSVSRPVTVSPLVTSVLQAQQRPGAPHDVMLSPSLASALQALSKAPINIQPKTRQQNNTRGVTVVPTSAARSQSQPPVKINLNVKVINPSKRSQCQTFVLRGVSSNNISTPKQLKEEILKQFGRELVPGDLDFPVGYTKSGTKVWIRTESDIADVWSFKMKSFPFGVMVLLKVRFQLVKVIAVQVIVTVMIQDHTREGARKRRRSCLYLMKR